MDVADFTDESSRETIARLEARIESLAAKLENCRKVSVAARIAVGAGIAIFVAGVVGFFRFDVTVILTAVTSVIGGLVLLGSNSSTANETADEMAKAEADRAALIGFDRATRRRRQYLEMNAPWREDMSEETQPRCFLSANSIFCYPRWEHLTRA